MFNLLLKNMRQFSFGGFQAVLQGAYPEKYCSNIMNELWPIPLATST